MIPDSNLYLVGEAQLNRAKGRVISKLLDKFKDDPELTLSQLEPGSINSTMDSVVGNLQNIISLFVFLTNALSPAKQTVLRVRGTNRTLNIRTSEFTTKGDVSTAFYIKFKTQLTTLALALQRLLIRMDGLFRSTSLKNIEEITMKKMKYEIDRLIELKDILQKRRNINANSIPVDDDKKEENAGRLRARIDIINNAANKAIELFRTGEEQYNTMNYILKDEEPPRLRATEEELEKKKIRPLVQREI